MVKNLYREVYLIHQDNLTLQMQVFEFFCKITCLPWSKCREGKDKMAERDLVMETEETGRFSIFESKIRPVLAEFVGSCILVFVVCSMSVYNFPLGVGLVYGFAMVFLIESLGNIR